MRWTAIVGIELAVFGIGIGAAFGWKHTLVYAGGILGGLMLGHLLSLRSYQRKLWALEEQGRQRQREQAQFHRDMEVAMKRQFNEAFDKTERNIFAAGYHLGGRE